MALFGRKKEEVKEEKKETKAPAASTSAKKGDKASVLRENEALSILNGPRITEKAAIAAEGGAYVFEVRSDATADMVADAVKLVYNVTPRKVNMVRIRPRKFVSRARGTRGQKSGYKKAYVHVKKGERIEIV